MKKVSESEMYHILEGNWYLRCTIWHEMGKYPLYFPKESLGKSRHFDWSKPYKLIVVNSIEEARKQSRRWLEKEIESIRRTCHPNAVVYSIENASFSHSFWGD